MYLSSNFFFYQMKSLFFFLSNEVTFAALFLLEHKPIPSHFIEEKPGGMPYSLNQCPVYN